MHDGQKVVIWKKPNSKNVKYDECPMAEDTATVEPVETGRVEITFTSGTVNKASDFIIDIDPVEMVKACIEAISARKEKPLTDFSEEELYAALKAKHINGG